MGGGSGGTCFGGDIAKCWTGWDQTVRPGMGGSPAAEGMSRTFNRCDAEQRQGKIVASVQDDCGASSGARKPAKVSFAESFRFYGLTRVRWRGNLNHCKYFVDPALGLVVTCVSGQSNTPSKLSAIHGVMAR